MTCELYGFQYTKRDLSSKIVTPPPSSPSSPLNKSHRLASIPYRDSPINRHQNLPVDQRITGLTSF